MSTTTTNSELHAIKAKIAEFADAFTQSREFSEFQKIAKAIRQDTHAQILLREYRQAVESNMVFGDLSHPEIKAKIDRAKSKVFKNPEVKRYLEAEERIIDLCKEMNATISESLGFDFAQAAAPAGGCC